MITTTTYTQAAFHDHLRWQAVSFMRIEWPSIYSGAGRLITDTYPAALDPTHFVVAEDEVLVSYAAVYRQPVTSRGVAFTMACFGNVFTYPPYRSAGWGTAVVRQATDHLPQTGADLAVLFCDPRLEAFYARCGWTVLEGETRIGSPEDSAEYTELRMGVSLTARGAEATAALREAPLLLPHPW